MTSAAASLATESAAGVKPPDIVTHAIVRVVFLAEVLTGFIDADLPFPAITVVNTSPMAKTRLIRINLTVPFI